MKADKNRPYCDRYFEKPLDPLKFECDFCASEQIPLKRISILPKKKSLGPI